MTECRKNERGFSLLELLIAMTIFAIGLLSIAGMQITAIRANSSANILSVTGAMAQRVMEDILSRSANDPFFGNPVANGTWDLDSSSAATTLDVTGAGTYSATYNVLVNDPVTNVSRIEVMVNGPHERTATLTGFKRVL